MIIHTLPMDNKDGVKGLPRELLLDTRFNIREKGVWVLHDITSYEFKPTELVITIDGPKGAFLIISPKPGQSKLYATKADVPEGDVAEFLEWPDGV